MSEFRVTVMASHPIIEAMFAGFAGPNHRSVLVTTLSLDADVVADASDVLAASTVAVLDASIDPAHALAVCQTIRSDHPDLPIAAVFCCPHAATAADLRALLAAGVGGVLDLQLSAEEIVRILQGVGRGEGAMHLQLSAGSSVRALLDTEPAAEELSDNDLGLLRLVALGLTDHEIGRQLFLSRHTVKHRIDRLRRRLHAKNRVELAAWAGRHDALRRNG
jgi:DNA-binding NarL/FixJ family response regulator